MVPNSPKRHIRQNSLKSTISMMDQNILKASPSKAFLPGSRDTVKGIITEAFGNWPGSDSNSANSKEWKIAVHAYIL